MLDDLVAEAVGVDVGVDLGGAYALVAEHALDDAQVGAVLEQVGGEGVAEGVGADVLLDACGFGELLDNVEDHDAREVLAAMGADEEVVLVAGLDVDVATVLLQVEFYLVDGGAGDGNETLLASLPLNADEAFVEEHVAELEVAELRHAEAAAVERLDDGSVAETFLAGNVDGIDDFIYLLDAEHLGQLLADLGRLEQLGGVGLDAVVEDEVGVERADAGEDARLRAGVDADVVERRGEGLQVGEGGIERALALVGEEAEELLHVAHIGVEGVRRERFLEDEVLPVLVEYHFIRIFWLFVHFIICIALAAKLQVHKRWGNLDEWVCMGMVTK